MNEIDTKLKNILYKKIDVNDEDNEEKYFNHLDHLIDAVIKIRFKNIQNNLYLIVYKLP